MAIYFFSFSLQWFFIFLLFLKIKKKVKQYTNLTIDNSIDVFLFSTSGTLFPTIVFIFSFLVFSCLFQILCFFFSFCFHWLMLICVLVNLLKFHSYQLFCSKVIQLISCFQFYFNILFLLSILFFCQKTNVRNELYSFICYQTKFKGRFFVHTWLLFSSVLTHLIDFNLSEICWKKNYIVDNQF